MLITHHYLFPDMYRKVFYTTITMFGLSTSLRWGPYRNARCDPAACRCLQRRAGYRRGDDAEHAGHLLSHRRSLPPTRDRCASRQPPILAVGPEDDEVRRRRCAGARAKRVAAGREAAAAEPGVASPAGRPAATADRAVEQPPWKIAGQALEAGRQRVHQPGARRISVGFRAAERLQRNAPLGLGQPPISRQRMHRGVAKSVNARHGDGGFLDWRAVPRAAPLAVRPRAPGTAPRCRATCIEA